MIIKESDESIIIVGAGLAGLTVALELAKHYPVIILCKSHLGESATAYAQGGIVGILNQEDSVESHVKDTIEAGAGLVIKEIAEYISKQSLDAIDWLIKQGVPFTKDPKGPKGLHLTREGGHSYKRIVHVNDATGLAIHHVLLSQTKKHPNIKIYEKFMAIDLITYQCSVKKNHLLYSKKCSGVYVMNIKDKKVEILNSMVTVLATGGVGRIYRYTSNPATATGDGIAMAWKKGCRISNMEFMQFHPTCLYSSQDRAFLITEALRGEGAKLRLPNGRRFMLDHDARAELAPRDIVSRAIDFEMKKHNLEYVLLDATDLGMEKLKRYFPSIYAKCKILGINISKQSIPVVPAAHYTCGGIVVDINGQTDILDLYAVGETACTGLHGANRLASNSLLECIVIGMATAQKIHQNADQSIIRHRALSNDIHPGVNYYYSNQNINVSRYCDKLRLLMWNYVGIHRTNKQLEQALYEIKLLKDEVQKCYSALESTSELSELRNLLICANLIVQSALVRKESRGLHNNKDYPQVQSISYPTILKRKRTH